MLFEFSNDMLFEFRQYNEIALLIMRLVIAAIFIYHALPKLKNPSSMGQAMGMPSGMIFTLGLVEFLSSIGMILGFYIQVAAFLLAMVMVGAIYFKLFKWSVPFSAHDKTGWEFDLILLTANLFILTKGGGSIGF